MSIRFLKRSLCVLLSFTVLVFSCVFMPRQRAEALSEVGVIGTCAGIMGLALLLYGVSVGDPSVFDANDAMTTASKAFVSAVGLGAFTDPNTPLYNAAFNATTYLKAAKEYASTAYSSGACSTEIQGSSKPLFTMSKDSSSALINDFLSLGFGHTSSNPYVSSNFSFYLDSLSLRPQHESAYYGTDKYFVLCSDGFYEAFFGVPSDYYYSWNTTYSTLWISSNGGGSSGFSFPGNYQNSYCRYNVLPSDFYLALSDFGMKFISYSGTFSSWSSTFSPGLEVDIPITAKPVIPGACDVFNSSKSLDSYHVDSPGNDVLDFGNLLTKTGCDTVDDVVSKVYTGELSASDVIGGLDCRPYVDVDVDTGTIAIPGDTTNSRPIALDQDLSIPSDIADTDTYIPLNPPADSDNTNRPSGSYTFPLSNFFPFCLPWDIYKVLSIFHTSPKAPVISIPLGSFFSDIPGVDKYTTDYVCTIDLGDENFKKWFQILRLLESIGIIVGFVLISRYLIHGGD